MNNEKWNNFIKSAHYTTNRGNKHERRKKEIIKAVNNIPDKYKNKKVLMLGCSDGCEMEAIKKRGFTNIVGLTYDRIEFKDAKQNNNVVRGEMHELPFSNNTFDFIYSKETLEHSIAPYIALYELNRVSKVGAEFLHYIAEGISKQSDWYHFSCFPPYVWVDLFHLNGFEIKRILSATNKDESEIIQSSYYGKKIFDKILDKNIGVYSLNRIYNRIETGKLDLLCD